MASEDAVVAVDDACDEVSLAVGVCDALLVYDRLRRGGEVVPNGVENILELRHLVEGDGRASVADDAAASLAYSEVAAERLCDDVEGDKGVFDFYDHRDGG